MEWNFTDVTTDDKLLIDKNVKHVLAHFDEEIIWSDDRLIIVDKVIDLMKKENEPWLQLTKQFKKQKYKPFL